MSSFTRRMQRNVLRKRSDYQPGTQITKPLKCGGYKTLTPTKGWRVFKAIRLAAQRMMAQLLDHVIRPAPKKPAKMYRKPAKAWPATETRQQRRRAERKATKALANLVN